MITVKCPNCDCVIHVDETPKPQTHADRIRSMTDEELAEFVWNVESSGKFYGPRGRKLWLDWLKQEASE